MIESIQTVRDGINLAWAAGLFDGEGSIGTLHDDARYCRITLALTMGHKLGVERFAGIFPFGNVHMRQPPGNRRPAYSWRVTHQGWVGFVLIMMRRHLTVKRAECDIAMRYLGLYDPTSADRAAVIADLRSHKSKPGFRGRLIAVA